MTTWECKEAIGYPLWSFSSLTKNVVAVYSTCYCFILQQNMQLRPHSTATDVFVNLDAILLHTFLLYTSPGNLRRICYIPELSCVLSL